jgi:hypothetical protein
VTAPLHELGDHPRHKLRVVEHRDVAEPRQLDVLEVPVGDLRAIVISHGHADHHGGFTRNYKLSTALLPRIDSLMRRPRLRRALLWQVAAHGERIPPAAAAQMVRDSVACPVSAKSNGVCSSPSARSALLLSRHPSGSDPQGASRCWPCSEATLILSLPRLGDSTRRVPPAAGCRPSKRESPPADARDVKARASQIQC